MKIILFFLLIMITFTSCSDDAIHLDEEKVVLTDLVSEISQNIEISADKNYHVTDEIGLTNFVELENFYYTGDEDINNLIDWSPNSFISLNDTDVINYEFKKEEQIRSIEVTNNKNNAANKLQFTFSNGTVKILELENNTENQSFEFDEAVYSRDVSIKSLDAATVKISEIHLVADKVMSKLDFDEYCSKSEKVFKLQNDYKWTTDIIANYKVINDIKEDFTLDELSEISEEIVPTVINEQLEKYIGFPLLIRGKVIRFDVTNIGYGIVIKSLLDQREYLIISNYEVDENMLVSLSGIVIGEDELNRIVIYGIK